MQQIALILHMEQLNYGTQIMFQILKVEGIMDLYFSSNWWWITLIVIGGVAILGVGGYFLYKHFVKKNVDPLLG